MARHRARLQDPPNHPHPAYEARVSGGAPAPIPAFHHHHPKSARPTRSALPMLRAARSRASKDRVGAVPWHRRVNDSPKKARLAEGP